MNSTRRIPFVNTSVSTDLVIAITLIPLFWILGLNMGIFHIVAFLLFLKALILSGRQKRLCVPKPVLFLGGFIIVYIFSLFLATQEATVLRLAGSVYNLSFWILGFVITLVIYNFVDFKGGKGIMRSFLVVSILAGVIAFIAVFLYYGGIRRFQFKSVLAYLLPSSVSNVTPLVSNSLQPVVWAPGYFGFIRGFLPRIRLYFVFPPSAGAFMAATIPFTFYFYKTGRLRLWFFLGVITLQGIGLFFSLARGPMLALALAAVLSLYLYVRKTLAKIVLLHLVALAVVATIVLTPVLPQALQKSLSIRGIGARTETYRETVEGFLKKPVLGHGYKPIGSAGIPVASHSTYLGVPFKTGSVGAVFYLFFVMFLVKAACSAVKRSPRGRQKDYAVTLTASLFVILIWQTFGDIDAVSILALSYFCLVGLVLRQYRAVSGSRGEVALRVR